jgi:hypothetical protein
MPVVPTYPGVYVEELPSGVRTITGVATSITAFIGFALKGPTNEPTRIQSFGDFERQFGGLWLESPMSYAVQQFFLNGGGDALIVRLSNPGSKAETPPINAGNETFSLVAYVPGEDGNQLRLTIDHDIDGTLFPDDAGDRFNLKIEREEVFPEGPETSLELELTAIRFDELEDELKSGKVARLKSNVPLQQRPAAVSVSFGSTEPTNPLAGGNNGGKEAKLRLPVTKDASGNDLPNALEFVLTANNEGKWGNDLQVFVDYDAKPNTFNLTVRVLEDGQVTNQEKLRNLSMDPLNSRYVVEALKTYSVLVKIDDPTTDIPEDPDPNVNKLLPPDATSEFLGVDSDQATDRGANGAPPDDHGLYAGSELKKTGIYALEKADLFNLLCIPPVDFKLDVDLTIWTEALIYCKKRRAMLLIDPPLDWATKDNVTRNLGKLLDPLGSDNKKNGCLFFPRIKFANPLKENRIELFPPSAAMAGIFARTDTNRGVWKAPAGIEAGITGARGLSVNLTNGENGQLNPLGVNCLRTFPVYGNVVWGSRTTDGDDRLASEWKYIPVRRLALYLEESLYRGTQWVVFEPNDEPLWAQIRLNIGVFMNNLFKQGAFQGKSAREAYFVKCDSETTTQSDIDRGIVNIIIGYAPLKPAEFVILKFQQIAGQLAT